MNKRDARIKGLQARAMVSPSLRKQYDASLLNQMKLLAEKASLIGCYVSMKDEADTRAFLSWCFNEGKRVAVPKISGKTLQFYEIRSFDDLHPASFGTSEPDGTGEDLTDQIDLMFVPLSSFDKHHNRTGYGRGYYDSILNRCGTNVGIAYAEQEVDAIETDPWDVKLDQILVPMTDQKGV